RCCARRAADNDITCLRPLAHVYQIELHAVALVEIAVALAVDGRIMDKNLLPAIIWQDKTKPLDPVEPLHSATGSVHANPPAGNRPPPLSRMEATQGHANEREPTKEHYSRLLH